MDSTLEKVKGIVQYFHKSTVATEKLRGTLRQMGLPDLKLVMDCVTQWNCTFHMLKRILQLKDAVITTLALIKPSMETLSHEEWGRDH